MLWPIKGISHINAKSSYGYYGWSIIQHVCCQHAFVETGPSDLDRFCTWGWSSSGAETERFDRLVVSVVDCLGCISILNEVLSASCVGYSQSWANVICFIDHVLNSCKCMLMMSDTCVSTRLPSTWNCRGVLNVTRYCIGRRIYLLCGNGQDCRRIIVAWRHGWLAWGNLMGDPVVKTRSVPFSVPFCVLTVNSVIMDT